MVLSRSIGEASEPLLGRSERSFQEIDYVMVHELLPKLKSSTNPEQYIIHTNKKLKFFREAFVATLLGNEAFYISRLANQANISLFELGFWLDECLSEDSIKNADNITRIFRVEEDPLTRFNFKELLYLPPRSIIPRRYISITEKDRQ